MLIPQRVITPEIMKGHRGLTIYTVSMHRKMCRCFDGVGRCKEARGVREWGKLGDQT